MKTSVAPGSDVANQFAFYSADFSAGNACPTFRTENGTVVQLNQAIGTNASPEFTGLTLGLVTKTGTYTTTVNDYTILCDASGGSFTINLIALASHLGGMYNIVKIDSSGNSVTVDGDSAETIDGAETAVLTVQYESVSIQAGSAEWVIL